MKQTEFGWTRPWGRQAAVFSRTAGSLRVLLVTLLLPNLSLAIDDHARAIAEPILRADWEKVAEVANRWRQSDNAVETADWLLGYAGLAIQDYRLATEGFSRLTRDQHGGTILGWADVLVKDNPKNAVAAMLRGDVLARSGKFEEAIQSLNRAIESDPTSPLAYNVRGVTRAMLGQFVEAQSDFEQAIRFKKDFADAYANLGLVRIAQGDLLAGAESLTNAIDLSPAFALAHNGRGVAFSLMQLWDEAEADFKKATELAPTLRTAETNARLVAWAKAQADFRLSIKQDHDDNRGSTLITQAYEHRSIPLGRGKTMDVFVIHDTPQTATLEGMRAVVSNMTKDLRTQNGLPDNWQPQFHLDAHGWQSSPYAQLQYGAEMGHQAGADAVIEIDLRTWFRVEKSPTWSANVTGAAKQVATVDAAINLITAIKPTFTGHSGGAEVFPRLGELLERGQLPDKVTESIAFGRCVLVAYPFHQFPLGDVAVPEGLLAKVDGSVYNFHTAPGAWSNKLVPSDKVANILLTEPGGKAIWHGDWTSMTLHGRDNPLLDVGGAALRGWKPQTIQQMAEQRGRDGIVPAYSVSVTDQITVAHTLASMTERSLRPGGKVLIGSLDAERAEVMLRSFQGADSTATWMRMNDLSQLQSIARRDGYSRILLVKSGPVDDVSVSLVSDGARLPAAPLPSVRALAQNIDRFKDAAGLVYALADNKMPGEQKLPLSFAAPLIQDLAAAKKGEFHPLTSKTLERVGEFGISELPGIVKDLKNAGRLPASFNLSPVLAGLPDIVAGGAAQVGRGKLAPSIDEWTHYLDGINKASWAVVGQMVGGLKGADIASTSAGLTADILRGATYPIFQNVANDPVRKQMVQDFRTHIEAAVGHGVQAQTFTKMFTPQLIREAGMDLKTVAELDSYAAWANSLIRNRDFRAPTPASVAAQTGDLDDVRRKLVPFFPQYFKPPDPPDKFGGAAVPTGNYRLPSGTIADDKRGGVSMKTDVVKDQPADLSSIFGGEASTKPAATVPDSLMCPFLIFCAMPEVHGAP